MYLSLRLLVVHNLARLTTRTLLRSLSRNTHAVIPVKQHLRTSKQLVDLLEGQKSGLGVEEVDEGNEEGVEYTEVDISLPADARDGYGCDFDDEEGENPVGGCGECSGAGSDSQGGVFGRNWNLSVLSGVLSKD